MAKKATKALNVRAKSTGSFWQSLPRPFFVLAPMANVTDAVFRKLFAKYGKPDVTWTEFVSADGLVSPGRDILLHDLVYSKAERPIVAQLFTGHPEAMRKAATLVADLGFDGLDINMGCPDRAVEKQGGGAGMIRDRKAALAVIEAAREGVQEGKRRKAKGEGEVGIPVSVKTRIGYNTIDLTWIEFLLEQKLPVLTVHLRTRKEMSEVPAHWELMPEIVKLRDRISPETLIIGNGDIASLEQAKEMAEKTGCDGVMIGRGIFGTPWFFKDADKIRNSKHEIRNKSEIQNSNTKTPEERLEIMLEHAKLFEKTFKGIKNFAVMKKHFKAYVNGWDGAKELRVKLMETSTYREVKDVVDMFLASRASMV